MARPSRSKKQPAFDPAELDDLILSPAVGTGVGSHLISETPPATVAADNERKALDMSTVVRSETVAQQESCRQIVANILQSTGITDLSTVDKYASTPSTSSLTEPESDLSTVDEMPTVDTSKSQISDVSTVADMSTVDRFEAARTSAEGPNLSTVDISPKPRIEVWLTEDGVLIPTGRVKRIRLAQDVINPGEEAVYDSLWNARPLQPNGSDFRIVQVGYDYLVKRTRLAKKTIQRIIDKLLDKDFIAIERPADIYQRTATVYRVFGYKTVLERHMQKGRAHVAKVGPGFSYVHQMPAPQPDHPDMTTVDRLHMTTVDKTTTETVVKKNLSTVVKMATLKIEHSELEQTSSEVNQIAQMLRQAIGTADDDVARRLVTECRRRAGDATVDEISEFLQQKARFAVRNPQIRNPTGFLLTAVPLCFQGESFRIFRQGREEAKRQEKAEMERVARMIIDDPQSSDDDRDWARGILGNVQLP